MDHDQRFKVLLREFFSEFLLLFFPLWWKRFDFSKVEFLDKEFFPDPPEGERRAADLVVKLTTKQAVAGQRPGEAESWLALVHIEVEHRDSVAPLRARMHDYYDDLRRRHRCPVLPIALYLQVGLDGLGIDVYEEFFWEFRPLYFQYLYVGLPALDAEQYVHGANWLGVALAALMRIPEERKAWLRAEAFRRLKECTENRYRRFLLYECVDAYLRLDAVQTREFEELLEKEPYMGLPNAVKSSFEEMYESRTRHLLQTQLEARFGPLSDEARARLESWPPDRFEELGKALLTAQSLRELGLEG